MYLQFTETRHTVPDAVSFSCRVVSNAVSFSCRVVSNAVSFSCRVVSSCFFKRVFQVQNIPEKFQLFFIVILSLFHIIYDYHCYCYHHHRDTCLSSGD